MTLPAPPGSDADVPGFLRALGVPGIVDAHVHLLPRRMLEKVWAYFDAAQTHYGAAWPVRYRTPEPERVATLAALGVRAYAPLVYPHKPGTGRWLTGWVTAFAAATPAAVPTATLYPEPDVTDYLGAAVAAGARVVKVHVQAGGFDPRDPLLRPAWGLLAEAGVPAVVHCGNGPIPGAYTGLDVFAEVLAAHPRLPVDDDGGRDERRVRRIGSDERAARREGWIRDDARCVRRYPVRTARPGGEGVNGFDSVGRSWGSVPRKATMISLTTRRKKTSADNSRTAYALAA